MTSKKISRIKIGFSEKLFIAGSLFLLVLLLQNPKETANSVNISLIQCATMLIPSLFPLMIASEIALNCGAIDYVTKPLSKIFATILGVNKRAVAPFFLGLIGGYTASVGGALSLYRAGEISKRDCERIIALSSIPSLSFMTGFVGSAMFKSSRLGWILWGITVFSAVITSFLGRKSKGSARISDSPFFVPTPSKKSPSRIVVEAISHSAYSMLIICACVVFFSVFLDTLKSPLQCLDLPQNMQKFLLGAFEITNGVSICAGIENFPLNVSFCAFMIGWSGFSVHCQIIALSDGEDLSFKRYFVFKAIQGLISMLLTFIIFNK